MNNDEIERTLALSRKIVDGSQSMRSAPTPFQLELARALISLHEECEELNGYAEAAQEFAKERDQLKSRVAELEKQLAESRAEAAVYRRALEEIKDQTEIERNPDFYQNERALPYAAALGLIFQRTKQALSSTPSEFLEAVEQAREALVNADEYSLQALPHLGGLIEIHGESKQTAHIEHFVRQTDAWITKALTRLNKVLGERGQS